MRIQRLADRSAVGALVSGLIRSAVTTAVGVTLASCVASNPPLEGPDPSISTVPVPRVGYRSTLQGYQRQRPAEPAPWIEQNRRVTPGQEGR